ncbi:MAG: M23 family metallopeptidase [Deltaproteobacteria bacterium]|nr:M23 family metallopeptidase [Deltaproteobacteria bacterium]
MSFALAATALHLRAGFLCVVLLGGCGLPPRGPTRREEAPPSESYAKALERTGLAKRAVGQRWLAAARVAVEEAAVVTVPHQEVVGFQELKPDARGWRVNLKQGQRLFVKLEGQSGRGQTFVDVLAVYGSGRQGYTLKSAESGTETSTKTALHFAFEVRRDGDYVVRVQPEIFAYGVWSLGLSLAPSYAFPVEGHDHDAVKSFFGAPRDRGRRRHHGVDIFAPKGTPVLAVVDGEIFHHGVDNLGGNVVWQWDPDRRLRIYYAHLEDWAVRRGDRVERGEVIGWVGNTGNAITTPPHLHFGVFDPRPVDPFPFIDDQVRAGSPLPLGPLDLLSGARVRPKKLELKDGPGQHALVRRVLPRNTALTVISRLPGGHQVELPDGERGYVPSSALQPGS